MCIFELILSIHFSNIFQNNFAAAWRTIKLILLNCWCISLLQHPANVISELSVYTVADRTDNWRVIRQLWMLSDWNQWTEVLTVTRWICQQPMMTSTCSGLNNSVTSLSCSSNSSHHTVHVHVAMTQLRLRLSCINMLKTTGSNVLRRVYN